MPTDGEAICTTLKCGKIRNKGEVVGRRWGEKEGERWGAKKR